ncbi:transposase [Paenibacillus brasilensis]|uniref:Transposase n=1 Tax=Paenibacillus brasilensis TaxID=128574 RepID=A0ABU0L7C9_9BACL|nr:transposase [Paenibacillus brasilensis]
MKSEEIERLNTAMKETSDKRLYERYLAVRLRLEGHSFAEIGDLLGRVRQTISLYWQNYQKHGLAGLEMDHSPGQPTKLTEEQRSQLATMLERMNFSFTKATYTLAQADEDAQELFRKHNIC